jgi:hypothetical protein
MMNKIKSKKPLLGVIVAVLLGLAGSVVLATSLDAPSPSWTAASSTDQEQIAGVLRDTMRARAIAARTFDVSGIRANIVNDPRVPLTALQRANLARFNPSAVPDGLLTSDIAFYEFWKRGNDAFERFSRARQAGREPDPADAAAAMPRRSDPLYEFPLTVHSVQVAGDLGFIEAETEAIYYRVTLVKRGDRWFVAGENNTPRN